MTCHAEDTLRCARIPQVLNLPLAVATLKAACAEGLVTGEYSQILDLVSAGIAAVCALIAYERAITEQKEIRIGVEEGPASVASEAINVPAVARQLKRLPFLENLSHDAVSPNVHVA